MRSQAVVDLIAALSPGIDPRAQWPFAEFARRAGGKLVGPWADVSRTGLAMRVGPDGTLGYAPNNLFVQSANLAASPPTWYHGANGNSITSEWGAAAVAGPVAGATGWAVQRAGGGGIVQNITLTAGERYDFVWWIRVPSGTASATLTGPTGNITVSVTTAWQRFNLLFTAASSGLTQLILNLSAATAYQVSMARFHQGGASNPNDDASLITTTTARFLPRIAYDPSTLAPLGLVVEGPATNILSTWSDFTASAGWTVSSLTTAPSIVPGPSGVVEGTTISAGTNTSQGVYKSFTVIGSTVYTLSMRVKLGTLAANEFQFALYDNSNAGFIASDIAPAQTLTADAWVRVVYTFTTPAGCTSLRVYPFRRSAALAATKTVHVSNGQLELGSVATSDIPNPGTGTALRAADDWFLSGSALDAALGAARATFTVWLEWFCPASPVNDSRILYIGNAAESRRVLVAVTTTGAYLYVHDGVTGGFSAVSPLLRPGQINRVCIAVTPTEVRGALNGISFGTPLARNFGGATHAERLQLLNDPPSTKAQATYARSAWTRPGEALTIAQAQSLTV